MILTPREQQVYDALLKGYTVEEIAASRSVDLKSVTSIQSRLMGKLFDEMPGVTYCGLVVMEHARRATQPRQARQKMYMIYRENGPMADNPRRIYAIVRTEDFEIALKAIQESNPTLEFEVDEMDPNSSEVKKLSTAKALAARA